MKRLCACVLGVAVLTGVPLTITAGEPASPKRQDEEGARRRDISGFWELNFDGRNVPRANLLPTITRAKIDARARADAYAIRWCNLLGLPFVMDPGRPLDIRQGTTAVIIVGENASAPRYLYTNRAKHISDEIFDPSTNGDSIARWEEDTLVVDTVGFHGEHGITTIPGGGFRTDKSRLVERYRLLKDGAVLSVTFTWTDPTVYRSPHTYEYRYHRLAATYEPRQWLPCDPWDEERAKFLDPPAVAKPAGRSTPKGVTP
jgi:hypothetical protein